MPPGANGDPRSPSRAGPARGRTGSRGRAGRRARRSSRRSRATPAGPRRPRRAVLRSGAGRSARYRRSASPGRHAVRSTPRPGPGTPAGAPRRPRLGTVGRAYARGLRWLGLGPHRPVDDQAQVDDRDLQDQHHEDELPDHRASVRDVAACGIPARARGEWAPESEAHSRAVLPGYRQPRAPSKRSTPSTTAVASPHAASSFRKRSTYDLPASTQLQ
jgi:hypothetical protein